MQRSIPNLGRTSARLVILATLLVPQAAGAQAEPSNATGSEAASSKSEGTASDAASKGSIATAPNPLIAEQAGATAPATKENAPTDSAVSPMADGARAEPLPESAAANDSNAAAAAPPAISVVRLPDDAYPEVQVRGIRGGSLAFTFHGMQWPYMPKKPGESALILGLSGWVWVDTGYERVKAGRPTESNIKYWLQQGRIVVRATPTYRIHRDWFIQGQAELVGNNDQSVAQPNTTDTDDLWVRAGKWNVFDVQLGRFQAWELYHLGMGLDLNTLERQGARSNESFPPDIYGTTYAWDRPSGAGNVAAHVYFTKYLRMETLGRIGNDNGNNVLGGRGALIFDIGWMKLKAGGEYLTGSNKFDNSQYRYTARGMGGTAQFVFFPYAEFGINAGRGLRDEWNDRGALDEYASNTVHSFGGFANARIIEDLVIGGGANYTRQENLRRDLATGKAGEFDQTQFFGALQYALFSKLYLKAVVGTANAHFAPSSIDTTNSIPPYDNTMLSMRLRASYYF